MSNFNSIIMKSKISMLLFVAAFAAACTNEMEEFAKDSFENVPENASLTRSCLSDTIDLGELVSLEETEELKELKARYEKMYSNNRKVQALDATVDDFFSSNIYAIRELPVTIKVRTVASGSSTSNSYLLLSSESYHLEHLCNNRQIMVCLRHKNISNMECQMLPEEF